jgi:hypothetical protein
MVIDEIIEYVTGLGGVLLLQPGPGDGSPEIAWGDTFFYYAPDGVLPKGQPFATIVTKDYPGDEASRLDRPDTFRVNMTPGKDTFDAWAGSTEDPSATDTVIVHPVYGSARWLAVVNPGPRTDATTRELLRAAHEQARRRHRPKGQRTTPEEAVDRTS